jgi:hypothetical protein
MYLVAALLGLLVLAGTIAGAVTQAPYLDCRFQVGVSRDGVEGYPTLEEAVAAAVGKEAADIKGRVEVLGESDRSMAVAVRDLVEASIDVLPEHDGVTSTYFVTNLRYCSTVTPPGR